MAPPKAKVQARLATREEPQETRMPDRMPDRGLAADPNGPILSRAGKPVRLAFTGSEDMFAFDRSIIPSGWDYQWKAEFIKNAPNLQHMTEMEANGWEAVPAERHDGMFMPRGYKGPIRRGGSILMERDVRLTAQARKLERKEALDAVNRSRQMAGMMAAAAPNAGTIADFTHGAAAQATGVRIERAPAVDDSTYKYSLDE